MPRDGELEMDASRLVKLPAKHRSSKKKTSSGECLYFAQSTNSSFTKPACAAAATVLVSPKLSKEQLPPAEESKAAQEALPAQQQQPKELSKVGRGHSPGGGVAHSGPVVFASHLNTLRRRSWATLMHCLVGHPSRSTLPEICSA